MSEVAAFVAFDQPWEQVVMQSFGIDTTRFAYAVDPRYNPMTPPLECRLCELGVLVCPRGGTAPDGVWVKFIPEYPRIDFAEWSDTAAYAPGDAVYRTETKDVYQCIERPTVGMAPETDTDGKWRPLRIRGEFAAYLTRLAAADLLTENQGKHQTRAAADREFELLCERYHEGNGETRLLDRSTANALAEMMDYTVTYAYGDWLFPGLNVCAKTGTAELGDGTSHAWFVGFLDDPDHPYAFVVMIEQGGGGLSQAGTLANTLLQKAVALTD